MNRTIVVILLLLLQCIFTSHAVTLRAEDLLKPNIVLFMADDLGYSDLGYYGGEIETPHIDRLAAGGIVFSHFYNTGRCCPTRASLMTGLYPHNAGVGHMLGKSPNGLYEGGLSENAITIAEGLREAGYSTYLSGKWHLTKWPSTSLDDPTENWPCERGFDEFYGTIASIRSYYNPPSLARNNRSLPPPEGDFYYTEAINDYACKVIEKHDAIKPFFLYVPHVAPHWPLHARESDIKKYEKRYLDGWDKLAENRRKQLLKSGLLDANWPMPPPHQKSFRWNEIDPIHRKWFARRMATYAAMVQSLDDGIGQIIETLRKRQMLENTLIIFLSDNGGCAEEIGPLGRAKGFPLTTRKGKKIRLGNQPDIAPGPEDTYASYGLEWAQLSNTPFRNFKSFVHEGGIATPAIFNWAGQLKSGMTDEVAHVIDILPTCLELADQTYPKIHAGKRIKALNGRSLVKTLEGEKRVGHQQLFWEHEGNCAVRQGDWKLVREYGSEWELYRLDRDRLEANNLSRTHPEKVVELSDAFTHWAKVNDVKPWEGRQTPIGNMTKDWVVDSDSSPSLKPDKVDARSSAP
ncbi:MAG: arylsulfatase [Pirellulales bacterium]